MSNKNILVVGCSFTKGAGLRSEDTDDKLWVNQLCDRIWPGCTVTNLAKIGANNSWIFHETLSALLLKKYDAVIVGWTAIPRFNVMIGLELYQTMSMLDSGSIDVNLNTATYTGTWLGSLGDDLRKLHNDHWDILDLIKYINALIKLEDHIFFVNALAPWPTDYFTKKDINQPSELSDFEQSMLSTQTRDDDEIFKLYNMIHEQYQQYGGINQDHWLNLYNSLYSLKIDDASNDDPHPGYKSQDVFANYLETQLLDKLK